MLLAINYSPEAATLLDQGHIHLDRFKCPDWPDLILEARRYLPVAVHFDLEAGAGRLAQTDWERIAGYLDRTDTPYVNLHISPYAADYPEIKADTRQPDQVMLILEEMKRDVRAVTGHFDPERVIAENLIYYGGSGRYMRPGAEPGIIRILTESCGCGFLLDISHARIAARYLGMDEKEYMEQLPVERLCELHFNGIQNRAGQPKDHLPIQEADWAVLEWVLERIRRGDWARPWMLAFEYGGVYRGTSDDEIWRTDPEVIATQVPRLYEMVHDL